jgi:signal transduction histidine kinase
LYAEKAMAASSVTPLARPDQESGASRRAAPPAPIAGAPTSSGIDVTVRPRRAFGIVVVLGVMLLQFTADFVAGHDTARILARLVFMACELPLLMVAMSAAFAWSLRRRTGAGQGLLVGEGIAMGTGVVFGVLYGLIALRVPDLRLHLASSNPDVVLLRFVLFGILNAQMYFGLWALAVVFPFAVEGARVRHLEAQQLRSEAEVARLRAHLEPHFLLNTLNAIAGLVTEDPREARRLVACLGDLLRDAVQETSELQRLDRQIAWLRRYAQILESRHRGALQFRWEVAPDCEDAVLPRLLLQPLVENAVKHGALRRRDGGGEVVVRASRTPDGVLTCVVEDNGPGMPDAEVRAGAFGLQAVRRRLALESPGASLRLESSPEGTRSIVEIAPANLEDVRVRGAA